MYTYFDDLQNGVKWLWNWRPQRRRAPVQAAEMPGRPALPVGGRPAPGASSSAD
jgi:hypothetical protein